MTNLSSLEIANAPTYLIAYCPLFNRIIDFYRISFQVSSTITFSLHEINGRKLSSSSSSRGIPVPVLAGAFAGSALTNAHVVLRLSLRLLVLTTSTVA